ncbi:unnamed protein product [Bursaphelenchus xylophilus]|uniref:(pine wood nematode) hypothetical protein n=1 Tax=Bursaphelenchus xylophilus TaxID=6326 RepID=A0A1I7RP56_BURXY|nr:unnamed protein product [Bursaphelenchus xylophilus]CAG9124574.1 unnamed protein product [Bursaphelenchus xylophilus]
MSVRSPSQTQVKCPICLERYAIPDTQQLSCEHRFCLTCLNLSANLATCPMPGCGTPRNIEVLVDEIDDNDDSAGVDDEGERHNRIVFGPNMLQLEERQRCEVIRGMFQCVNVARLTTIDCHHRVCFDCVAKSVTQSDSLSEPPRCPIARCANFLCRAEVMLVAEKLLPLMPVYKRIAQSLPEVSDENKPTLKDELRIYCSVYGGNASSKIINIPRICSISDMVNAIMQILKVDRNRTPLSIGIFIRVDGASEKMKSRYENLNISALAKKMVKDSGLPDRSHIVLDLNNELRR